MKMKKAHFKQVFGILLLLIFSVVMCTPIMAFAQQENDVMVVSVMQSFSGVSVGDTDIMTNDPSPTVTGKPIYVDNVPITRNMAAKAVERKAGIEDSPAVEITLSEETSFGGGAIPYFRFDGAEQLNSNDYIMFYIELAPSSTEMNLSARFVDIENPTDSSKDLYVSIGNRSVKMLKQGSTQWTDVDMSQWYLSVEAGFKGFLKFRVGDLRPVAAPDADPDITGKRLLWLGVDCGKYGGDAGSVYLDACYRVTSDADTSFAQLGADGEALDLFAELPQEEEDPGFMNVKILQSFQGWKYGDDVRTNNANEPYDEPDTKPIQMEDGNFPGYQALNIAIPKRAGIEDSPAVKIGTTEPTSHDGGARINVKFTQNNLNIDLDDHIMFYIELGPTSEHMFIGMRCTDAEGYTNEVWGNLARGVKTMAVGETEWKDAELDYGRVKVPAGFKGFVKLRIGDIRGNATPDEELDLTGKRLDWLFIDADKFGGDTGCVVLDAFYLVTDDSNSALAKLNGEGEALNIFTGTSDGTESPVDLTENMVAGEKVESLPEKSLQDASIKDIQKENIKASEVTVEWDAVENATSYKVDVFKDSSIVNKDETLQWDFFEYVISKDAGSTASATISGLQENTKYYIVVTAYADGQVLGVMDFKSFTTIQSEQQPPVDDGKDDENTEEENTGCSGMLAAGIGGVVTCFAIISASAVLLGIIARRRKGN